MLTWTSRVRKSTYGRGFFRVETGQHSIQTLMTDRRQEMFDVRTRETIQRLKTKRSVFCYAWTPDLSHRQSATR